ncbi:MAG: NAD-dependent succinate-semialdehyde dehydrogenase [Candidatus Accumulibacter sp.]|jgi:succinate-semialdehyde dehydrogenase/glutarate-semialdehyde dehydrogenase|nr:NAD-dependent succinate-semialdehyde dehydrogenase [Accumulibacter sp.]
MSELHPDLSEPSYETLALYIDGEFLSGDGRPVTEILNPATGAPLGLLPHATRADLERALAAAERAFPVWRQTAPTERARILYRAAALTRERARSIGRNITLDQGKPLAEAVEEVAGCADHAEWHGEEGRRVYGRVIPPRRAGVRQIVLREPVGVCAAFTPWNFPFNQAIRKIAAALGAGCTLILKGPEESPSAVVALARIFHDAGLPPGALNIVWGVPGEVAEFLIAAPVVRKISLTGSVPVGRALSARSGAALKRVSLELGGHAPAIVFPDADVERAAEFLARFKLRNAGQICIAPSRFYVHESVFARFLERFLAVFRAIRIGNGLAEGTQMGPLHSARRRDAVAALVEDARARGANLETGGQALPGPGHFYAPTVLTDVPEEARILHEEPFGPVAPILRFSDTEEVIARANALPYGLAAYVFTTTLETSTRLADALEAGMVFINQVSVLAEIPFGGIKESGVGSEGGSETFDAYLNTKFVFQA